MALKQVTGLTTGAAATILVPPPNTKLIVIQNLGANAVNITVDGGSTYTDLNTGVGTATGNDPTTGATGLGIVIPPLASGIPGSFVISTIASDSGLHKPIRAIMQTSTTTLNISIDCDLTAAQAAVAFPTN